VIDFVVKSLIGALEDAAIPYMVVGSYSSNYYGIPRSTRDLDIVIEVNNRSVADLSARLGPEFVLDPQMSFETATFTIKNVIRIKNNLFEIELFHLSEDEHDQERFRRRVQVLLSESSPYLPTPEDVIITKLRWLLQANREKDRLDVFNVIQARSTTLDWPYVKFWCERHATRGLLDEIKLAVDAS